MPTNKEPTNTDWLRSQLEEAAGGYPDGKTIRDGVQKTGEKNTPNWLKFGCLGTFSIPIVGGVIGIIDALSTKSPEIAILACAGSLGLLGISIGILIKKHIKK